MNSIFTALAVFIVAVIVHIPLHRRALSRGRSTFYPLSVFGIGGVVLAFVFADRILRDPNWWQGELPLTALALYTVLSLFHSLFAFVPSLGYESPTARIMLFLSRRGKPERDIVGAFTNEELIGFRLFDLVRGHLISRSGGVYRITRKGLAFISLVRMYRNLIAFSAWGRGYHHDL